MNFCVEFQPVPPCSFGQFGQSQPFWAVPGIRPGLGRDGADGRIHLFFGPLTGQKWGETQYKHFDHHLGRLHLPNALDLES